MADGVRFPDQMSELTDYNENNKVLVSDIDSAKTAKWFKLSKIVDWFKSFFAQKDAANITQSEDIQAWVSALKISLTKDALLDASSADVEALADNGFYVTTTNTINLPVGVNRVGVLRIMTETTNRYLQYYTKNSGVDVIYQKSYDGSVWTSWGIAGGIWTETVENIETAIDKPVKLQNRLLLSQGDDIDVTNEIEMLFNGNTWVASNVISTAIKGFSSDGWAAGSTITLYLDKGQLIEHDASSLSEGVYPIKLPDGQSFTTTLSEFTKCQFQLIEKGGETFWAADYFAQASQVERSLFLAETTEFPCYSVNNTTYIEPFLLNQSEIDEIVTADSAEITMTKTGNDFYFDATGKGYNVELKNSSGTTIYKLPLNEAARVISSGNLFESNSIVRCTLTGIQFKIYNIQALTTQNTDNSVHVLGVKQIISSDGLNRVDILNNQDGSDLFILPYSTKAMYYLRGDNSNIRPTGNALGVVIVSDGTFAQGRLGLTDECFENISINGAFIVGNLRKSNMVSFAFWIKLVNNSTRIFETNLGGESLELLYNSIQVRAARGTFNIPFTNISSLNDGNWHHVIFEIDETSFARCYIDSILEATVNEYFTYARVGFKPYPMAKYYISEFCGFSRYLTQDEKYLLYKWQPINYFTSLEQVSNIEQKGAGAGYFIDANYKLKFPSDISSKISTITGGENKFTFDEYVDLATITPDMDLMYADVEETNIQQVSFTTDTGEKYVKSFED